MKPLPVLQFSAYIFPSDIFLPPFISMKICSEKQKKTEDGKDYYKVTYPKFKLGEEVVREIAVPPTYGKVLCMWQVCMVKGALSHYLATW